MGQGAPPLGPDPPARTAAAPGRAPWRPCWTSVATDDEVLGQLGDRAPARRGAGDSIRRRGIRPGSGRRGLVGDRGRVRVGPCPPGARGIDHLGGRGGGLGATRRPGAGLARDPTGTPRTRQVAIRLLRTHPCERPTLSSWRPPSPLRRMLRPRCRLVTLDARLAVAAEREGFRVVGPGPPEASIRPSWRTSAQPGREGLVARGDLRPWVGGLPGRGHVQQEVIRVTRPRDLQPEGNAIR